MDNSAEMAPLDSEDALARRVKHERERRAWSTAGLAKKVTDAGCPMNQSAVWKIENGEPRRKITVDEALAFARVFDTTLEELLMPPELIEEAELHRLLSAYRERWAEVTEAGQRQAEADQAIRDYLRSRPGAAGTLREILERSFPDGSHWPADMVDMWTED